MRSRKPRDGAFPSTHRISQRTDSIRDKSKFGHWEGDLVIFERPLGHANVTTLVKRKSRYTVLTENPRRHSGLTPRSFLKVGGLRRQCSPVKLQRDFAESSVTMLPQRSGAGRHSLGSNTDRGGKRQGGFRSGSRPGSSPFHFYLVNRSGRKFAKSELRRPVAISSARSSPAISPRVAPL